MSDRALREADEMLDRAEALFDEGRLEESARAAGACAKRARRLEGDEARAILLDALFLLGDAMVEMRRDEDALETYAEARKLDPDAPEAQLGEGRLRLMRWELDPARRLLDAVPEDVPPQLLASVRYHQAILAELAEDFAGADRRYREAHALDPDTCPLPVRITEDDALAILDEIVQSLPEDVRGTLENVVFDVVDLPDPKLDGADNPPTVLGVFHGAPVNDAFYAEHFLPNTIRVFRRNLERIADHPQHLRDELRITILHEIGHHLGWDEDDLAERGLG